MLKVTRHGILSVVACQRSHFLLHLTNGQILVYNTKTRKTLYETNVAHTDQVQQCKISNYDSNLLGSIGFDGTLRVWDLRSRTLKSMFEDRNAEGNDKIISCLAWYNPKNWTENDPCRNLAAIGTKGG